MYDFRQVNASNSPGKEVCVNKDEICTIYNKMKEHLLLRRPVYEAREFCISKYLSNADTAIAKLLEFLVLLHHRDLDKEKIVNFRQFRLL